MATKPIRRKKPTKKKEPNYKKLFKEADERCKALSEENIMLSDSLKNFKISEGQAWDALHEVRNQLKHGTDSDLMRELVDCLSEEQKDAARTCGVREELYAVELLKLFQEWKKKPKDTSEIALYFGL
jgi:hypothetical protein